MAIRIGRREFIAALGSAATVWPLVARGQEPAPRIIFSPPLGLAQDFRVNYRYRERPPTPAGAVDDRFIVNNRVHGEFVNPQKNGAALAIL
jgi:hypothetical protein